MAVRQSVADQYDAFPYPQRRPDDERTRLISGELGELALVNHLYWSGQRAFDEDFRVLDAGCGTGDAAIFMAEQLRDTGARVTGVDLSQASLAVARARAEVRGLDNVDFQQAALEDLPQQGLGSFDWIVSFGVLHHLESPQAGLNALRELCKPDGGIGVMIYGRWGRLPVYQLQELFRLLAPEELGATARIKIVQATLSRLNPAHWATIGADSWQGELQDSGDAALVDLFLHAQDRAYTVAETYDFVESCGMRVARPLFPIVYQPRTYLPDAGVDHLGERERHAVGELLHGRMSTHQILLAHADHELPAPHAPDDETAIPAWVRFPSTDQLSTELRSTGKAAVSLPDGYMEVRVNDVGRVLLDRVDGRTPLAEVLTQAASDLPGVERPQLEEEWLRAFASMYRFNLMVMNPVG